MLKEIPGKLNNSTIVGFMERLRKVERKIGRGFPANDRSNMKAYEERVSADPGFDCALIEKQSEFDDIRLGKSTLDYSGCEVIACYNLLQRYDGGRLRMKLPEIIEMFERDGIIHAGRFGVSPKAIYDHLIKLGTEPDFTMDEGDFDLLGEYCDHFILTVMNDEKDIMKQVHTFYISREGRRLISHNAGLRMRYFSIDEIIKALPGGRARGISLTAVREKGIDG